MFLSFLLLNYSAFEILHGVTPYDAATPCGPGLKGTQQFGFGSNVKSVLLA